VERAFRLWANGDIMLQGSGKPTVTILKGTNPVTGRSSRDTAFTELHWGKATRGYLTSIQKISTETLDLIVRQAQELTQIGRLGDSQMSFEEDEEQERAVLVEGRDESNSEMEC
jgi:hypothetical protein